MGRVSYPSNPANLTGHFDAVYELNRAVIDPTTGEIITREAALSDVSSMHGFFGDLGISLGPFLEAQGADE